MTADPAEIPNFESLPRTLPLFPLASALLLPNGRLPLNIFEPRYLAMPRDAMSGHGMIGMVQPLDPDSAEVAPEPPGVGSTAAVLESN